MSVTSRLAALLDQATPGPWEFNDSTDPRGHKGEFRAPSPYNGFMLVGPWTNGHDARLIALAPDMARLFVDDRPVIEWAASVACLEPNEDGVSVCGRTCVTCVARALLARFAALDEKAGGA